MLAVQCNLTFKTASYFKIHTYSRRHNSRKTKTEYGLRIESLTAKHTVKFEMFPVNRNMRWE